MWLSPEMRRVRTLHRTYLFNVSAQSYPSPSGMPHSYPGSELSVEQLVHALAQVLNPDSLLRRYAYTQSNAMSSPLLSPFSRKFLDLELRKVRYLEILI